MQVDKIKQLFKANFAEKIQQISKLPISGSSREYYKISTEFRTVIATYGLEKKENEAFIYLAEHFLKKGINVPKVYAENLDHGVYLQEDLGNKTLYSEILNQRKKKNFSDALFDTYKKVLQELLKIQTKGAAGLDFTICYPRAAFDEQSIFWDLNYFKYNFLKLSGITFDEQWLENDFKKFAKFLLQADTHFFLFRDFQSRNIMLVNDKVFLIDFQGGRKGALQYDLASLLYDAKAEIPENMRAKLKHYYTEILEKETQISPKAFDKHYFAFVLIRIMQAMGAYGFRGIIEKKEHFLQSIPPALLNLEQVLKSCYFLDEMPELKRVLTALPESEHLKSRAKQRLKVSIKSFSYKRGFPYDPSGNGGGHIFDCRFMDNPGRIEQYKKLCGKEQPVIDYLVQQGEAELFLQTIFPICSRSIQKYLSRNFDHFSIAFGCTGGQHRSVYCAERTAKFLSKQFDIDVELLHTEGW